MIDTPSQQKLLELSEKAIAVEKEILQQEKRYQKALMKGSGASFLLSVRENIKSLYRKELLFFQVIESRLKVLQ
jgi:hypothetical protein